MASFLRLVSKISKSYQISSGNIFLNIVKFQMSVDTKISPNTFQTFSDESNNIQKSKEFEKSKIAKLLESKNEISKFDLIEFIYMSKTDHDIELILNGLKAIKDPNDAETLGISTVKLLFVLKKTEKLLELLSDKNYDFYFKKTNTFSTIIKLFIMENRFQDCLNLFDKQEISYLLENFKVFEKNYFLSVYAANENKSMNRLIEILNKLKKKRYKITHAIYPITFAINQKDFDLCEYILSFETNTAQGYFTLIYKNIESIIYAGQSKFDLSIKKIKEIIDFKMDEKFSKSLGLIFPFTFETFKHAINKSTMTNKEQYLEEIQKLNEIALKEKLMRKYDLYDFLDHLLLKTVDAYKTEQKFQNIHQASASNLLVEHNFFLKNQQKNVNELSKIQNLKENSIDDTIKKIKNEPKNSKELFDLMKELYFKKKFLDLYNLFVSNLKIYKNEKNETSDIPLSHLNLITQSLFEMNTKKSYENLKSLSQVLKLNKSTLSAHSKLHLCLLAIHNNDPYFALGYLNISGVDKSSTTLYKNIKLIALATLNEFDESINEMKDILKINHNMFTNEGCLFPYTKKVLNKKFGNINSTKNKEFSILMEKIKKESRISNIDLNDICTIDFGQKNFKKIENKSEKSNIQINKNSIKKLEISNLLESYFGKRLGNKFFSKEWFHLIIEFILNNEKIDSKIVKSIVELIKENNLELKDENKIMIFLKLIKMKDPLYALEFLSDVDSNQSLKQNFQTVYKNLLIIGFSLIGKIDIALKIMDSILIIDLGSSKSEIDGRIFKLTIEYLEDAVMNAIPKTEDYVETFNRLKQQSSNRLIDFNYNYLEKISSI